MRVLMFKEQFVAGVRSGAKIQTIRVNVNCRPGDTLSLRRWTGRPRRSKTEVLRDAVCRSVVNVYITLNGSIFVNAELLGHAAAERFAKDEGFATLRAMLEWFGMQHGLPFAGEVIHWFKGMEDKPHA